jgi:putative ubiquitin-RnfH superfamily antitoxin RatB of RatAB toxin-antitoxin module
VKVIVCYATEEEQLQIALDLPDKSTVMKAILASGILDRLPEIKLEGNVGIFSQKVTLNQVLQEGDRVEIYRPLLLTPNQLRLMRAKKKLPVAG